MVAKVAQLKSPAELACFKMFEGRSPVVDTAAPKIKAQMVGERFVALPIKKEIQQKKAVIAKQVNGP